MNQAIVDSAAGIPAGALSGIKVLDLTRFLAGPFCTVMLGDLGADVVKIERPGLGEENRTLGTVFSGGFGAFFLAINRNKRSIALDLKSEEGRARFRRLADAADVVVENFRPGTMEKLGLGFEELRKTNPGLVFASISAFGTQGPDTYRPGFDATVQAETGLMDVNADADGPRVIPMDILDTATGMYTSFGIVSALFARKATGRGQRVDTSLLGSAVGFMNGYVTGYHMSGQEPEARRGRLGAGLRTKDGRIMIGFVADGLFQQLCRLLGVEELVGDPRFIDPKSRARNSDELAELLSAKLMAQPSAHWVEVLRSAGLAVGEIRTLSAGFQHPQALANGLIEVQDHPAAGRIVMPATPVRLSETPMTVRLPAPGLGENEEEVFRDWLDETP